ncbi:TIGR04222 domain-containing membrane protein [Nostoc sp. WHI]|uniref:TIGR04222 domain-containing membrane protein n=1 Tax=Nostoc sp. WHI TaxID=2650611 RepID=UPI0018C7A79A|nr:TIGR04222 domain-containing membrane protein [Nostoc sp. WHI]MBG1267212.1 TIGR04222 domain-containing membrane protein [Nostoc sp. WHI]
MNALLHNPIADMYGVDFLLFYCSVIGITLVVCWQLIKDPTKNQPLPLIPAEPDPYEIAYLRSQETGIANVVLFDLIVRGYLQVSEQSISQVANHPDVSQLQPIEREVFDRLSSSSTAKTSLSLATKSIQLYCNAYEEKLQNEQLLYAFQWQIRNIIVVLIGAMIIFSLWGYKLLIVLGKGGHEESFLVSISFFYIVFLLGFVSDLLQGFVSNRSHLSQRGKVYLQQLQATFSRLQQKVKNEIPSVFDYNLVVALFGVEALAGTSYNSYYKAFFPPTFSRTASRGSRSSGSSSSSSSDSGSSCSSSLCSSSSESSSSCSSSSSDSSCSSSSCSSSSDSGSSCSSSSCSSSSCGGGGCGGG